MKTGRLETLRNRYERLIEANLDYRYASSTKADRYLKVIRLIKSQIRQEEAHNKEILYKNKYNL